MKKIPLKYMIIWGSAVTLLVTARCVVTAMRERYYNRSGWMDLILRDPWFYVGIAAAAVACVSAVTWLLTRQKKEK